MIGARAVRTCSLLMWEAAPRGPQVEGSLSYVVRPRESRGVVRTVRACTKDGEIVFKSGSGGDSLLWL